MEKIKKIKIFSSLALIAGLGLGYGFWRNRNHNRTQRQPASKRGNRANTSTESKTPVSAPVAVQAQAVKPRADPKPRRARTTITEDMKQKMYKLSENHTNKEVAALCDIPEITVNRHLGKARKVGLCKPAKRGRKRIIKLAVVNTTDIHNN